MRSGNMVPTALIAILVMLLSAPTGSALIVLGDIEDHWAQETIEEWVDKDWIGGFDDGTFRPDEGVTRAQFAALTNRAFGFTDTVAHPFVDVPDTAWYAEDVARAVAAGYIEGYEDQTFRPDNPITRVEAASILFALLDPESADEDYLDAFSDSDAIPAWGAQAANAVVHHGLLTGYPDGSFRPGDSITRAESVVILDRSLEWVDGRAVLYLDEKAYYPDQTVYLTTANRSEMTVELGHPFGVEKYEDGEWIEVELDLAWIMILESLAPGEKLEQSFVPAEDFAEVIPEAGHRYRVRKAVHYVDTDEEEVLTAEFEIVPREKTLREAKIGTLYCERYRGLDLSVTLSGALSADERIRIDFTQAAEHGIYFDGDPGDIEVYPAGEVSWDPTVPPGTPVLAYSPDEDLPHGTVVEMTIDPGDDTTPPGMSLGCEDETAFEESPHEIVFERTDSGATTSALLEVAGPVPVTFIVQSEVGDPIEDATVMINGYEGATDEEGTITFTLVPMDRDYLVQKEGYHDSSGGVEVIDEPITREVVLTEKAPESN